MFQRMLALSATVLALGGCFMIQGHAEMVKRGPAGGILTLKGDHDKAMADAKQQMASNCPNGYNITGEEMVKVGERTEGAEDTSFEHNNASKNTASETHDVKEYQITYECTAAATAAAPTAGGEAG